MRNGYRAIVFLEKECFSASCRDAGRRASIVAPWLEGEFGCCSWMTHLQFLISEAMRRLILIITFKIRQEAQILISGLGTMNYFVTILQLELFSLLPVIPEAVNLNRHGLRKKTLLIHQGSFFSFLSATPESMEPGFRNHKQRRLMYSRKYSYFALLH